MTALGMPADMRRWIRDGRIGTPLSAHLHRADDTPGLADSVDALRGLLGDVASVAAPADLGYAGSLVVAFASGAMGVVTHERTNARPVRTLSVVGTRGSIACDLVTGVTIAAPRSRM